VRLLEGLRLEPGVACSLATLPVKEKGQGKKHRFICGPIPARWIEQAAGLPGPGKALHVAVLIRYLDGFEKIGTVKLRPSVRNLYGMDRFSCKRGLDQLERAGLISVLRKRGSSPVVTIMSGKPATSNIISQ
jgi:hypothetical protein